MSRRIDARELLAAAGGLLVLISLFLAWYEPDRDAVFRGNGLTAWEAFEALDLLLAALALVVIATGAQSLGTVGSLGGRALLPLGAVMSAIVVIQLASPPPVAWGADIDLGGWLALAGSLLVLAAGILRAARISIALSVDSRESRPRVAAVDRRPGAAAAAPSAASASPVPPKDTGAAAGRADKALSGSAADADTQRTQPFKPVDEA